MDSPIQNVWENSNFFTVHLIPAFEEIHAHIKILKGSRGYLKPYTRVILYCFLYTDNK